MSEARSAGRPAIDYDALVRRFLAAQLEGDPREALRAVIDDGLAHGADVTDLRSRVIRAAQHELGRLWEANQISVAEEHLATGVAQVVLARLFEHDQPTPRNHRVVVIACVQGELHELPARLVADHLDHGGFTVRYLGADLPTRALVPMLDAEAPQLLALSATAAVNTDALRDAVTHVRATRGPRLPILIGGQVVDRTPELARALDAETAPDAPLDMIEVVRRLTGVS